MKVDLVKSKFAWGTNTTSKIISNKANLPILSNILITALEKNLLQIESSNLDLSIRLSIPAKVEKPGKIAVPARKFTDYIQTINEEKISLSLEKNQLHI